MIMSDADNDNLALFKAAVEAIDSGNVARLAELLSAYPHLGLYQCRVGEYESGYFAGATLLHHITGNPIRCPIPPNIVEVATLLLAHDFLPDALRQTIGLLLTSKQASDAHVALPLIDLLVATGAVLDLDDPETLTMPILNSAPDTAKALIARGAVPDLRHAAGLGLTGAVATLLADQPEPQFVEEALLFASMRGELDTAKLLVDAGATGNVLFPRRDGSRTALHEAANRGYDALVCLLVASGADVNVIETCYGGTPAHWADHGGHKEIAEFLRSHK